MGETFPSRTRHSSPKTGNMERLILASSTAETSRTAGSARGFDDRRIRTIGRTFFALGMLGLACEHFIFGDFVTARAPAWPENVPGRLPFAYATGVVFILCAAAILFRRRERTAALILAGSIVVWAVLRHVPIVIAANAFSGAWTQAGKAFVLLGGALAIAALPVRNSGGRLPARSSTGLRLATIFLSAFLVLTGIQHFLHTVFVASLIPTWFPGNATFWTYLAGIFLISGGVGMNVARTARLAALLVGAMVFSWFWIVHIPRTFASVSDGLAVFEALAVSGIALMLASARRS